MATATGACPKCGQINSYSAISCIDCGTKLPWADALYGAQTASLPPQPGVSSSSSPAGACVRPRPLNNSAGCATWFVATVVFSLGAAAIGTIFGLWAPLLIILGTTAWVAVDANSHGDTKAPVSGTASNSAAGWAIGCLLLWAVCFPAYLIVRPSLVAAPAVFADEEGLPSAKGGANWVQFAGGGLVALLAICYWIGSQPGKPSSEQTNSSQFQPAPSTNDPAGTTPAKGTGQTVMSLQGEGIKQSPSFRITGSQWTIRYSLQQTDLEAKLGAPTSLGIIVHDATTNQISTVAVNIMTPTNDSTIVHGSGTYYLEINSTGDWNVSVTDG